MDKIKDCVVELEKQFEAVRPKLRVGDKEAVAESDKIGAQIVALNALANLGYKSLSEIEALFKI